MEGMKTVQEFLQSTHVYFLATLVEDPRVEIKQAMLDANPGLRNMYNPS